MALERATGSRSALHSNVTAHRDASNEVERVKISQCQPAGSATNSSLGLLGGAPLQTLLDAVEVQRRNLVNVLGIVHSMSASFTDTAGDSSPEISAAFALLEQEIQRVVAGLKEASLRAPT
jgi:microsomal dipeptidase-like Zn-dependent dipeptidase